MIIATKFCLYSCYNPSLILTRTELWQSLVCCAIILCSVPCSSKALQQMLLAVTEVLVKSYPRHDFVLLGPPLSASLTRVTWHYVTFHDSFVTDVTVVVIDDEHDEDEVADDGGCVTGAVDSVPGSVLGTREGAGSGEGSAYQVNIPDTWRSRALCHME